MRIGVGMTAAALALAGVAAVALAQPAPQVAPARSERVKAMFAQVDTDRDGFVTKAEADAARAAARARMDAARKERRDRAFARLDGDRNGQISRAEFDAAPRMAMMGAAGPDGPRERMGRRGGRMAAGMPMFERMDADKDGRVSLAEAEAWQPRRWAMRGGGRRGGPLLPPGHPPLAGAPGPAMSDSDRPLGGGRD